MNKGIAVGGGSTNGRLEYNMFTYGTWWEDIRRTVKLDDYTYKNTTGYIFGNASNISGFSNCEFGLKYGIVFQSQDGGIPRNISMTRTLLDNPFAETSLHLKAGNDLSFIGLSTGVHSGKLIIAEESFSGRARIYGQNFWGGAQNLLRNKDIRIYDSSSDNVDIINHNFKFLDAPEYAVPKVTPTNTPTKSQPSPTPKEQPTVSVNLTPGISSESISGEQSDSQGDEISSDPMKDSTENSSRESHEASSSEGADENNINKPSDWTVLLVLVAVLIVCTIGLGVLFVLKQKKII